MIDIGTGDGRFVSRSAARNTDKFFIGIDANVKPLEKPSMKATRNPAKGGLPNVLFVRAAIEDLPEEFDGVADEIHIHFPWGSLLAGVLRGDEHTLSCLRRMGAPDCVLEIISGVDPERDETEVERLGLPSVNADYLLRILVPAYRRAGFDPVEIRELTRKEWSEIETTWARRLRGDDRQVYSLVFRLASEGTGDQGFSNE